MEIRLGWLLGSAWLAGTLPILIASLPFSRLNSFRLILLSFAKRGKTMPKSSRKFTVPQSWFMHFYLVGSVWTTLLLAIMWHYAYKIAPVGSGSLDYSMAASGLTGGSHISSLHKSRVSSAKLRYGVWVSVFLLLLMQIHVVRRLYETLYVFKYSSSARMHILGYFTGLFFYSAVPLSFCHFYALDAMNFVADEIVQLSVKRQEISTVMDFNLLGFFMPITKLGWCQWLGAAIFAWGCLHQFLCHSILGSLRKHRAQTDEYLVPHGDWFEIVSCPHYLAEMVIYVGLLVTSGGTDITLWLLLLFVIANLIFAAVDTQKWYIHKFENYPPNRRAIIPYIC